MPTVDTIKLRETLLATWPIERPTEQAAPTEVEQLIAIGLMYREDVGHGWTRYGLTDVGREVVRNGDVAR
jgi:hypothetical protein